MYLKSIFFDGTRAAVEFASPHYMNIYHVH